MAGGDFDIGHFISIIHYILCVFFVSLDSWSLYNTLAFISILVPYSMDEFAWSKQQAIFYNSVIFSLLALLATASYIVVGIIAKK